MVLPNFLIFGVQKAGTTSIYKYLKEHPQVFMSPLKETDFFGRPSALSGQRMEAVSTTKGGRKKIETIEDYRALFEGASQEIAIGEASPNYLFLHDHAVPAIQKHVPDAKLIAILRNPVDRAYSDYLMHVREAIGEPRPLAVQVEKSPESSYTLLKGRYYEGVKHFLDAFGREQVKIFLYDELRQDTPALMREVYDFIGVDSTFEADTSKQQQKAEVPKNQSINKLLRTNNPLRTAVGGLLRTVLPEERRQKLRSLLIAANSQGKSAMPLSSADAQVLTQYYREDVLRLQDLLARDLSHWLSE